MTHGHPVEPASAWRASQTNPCSPLQWTHCCPRKSWCHKPTNKCCSPCESKQASQHHTRQACCIRSCQSSCYACEPVLSALAHQGRLECAQCWVGGPPSTPISASLERTQALDSLDLRLSCSPSRIQGIRHTSFGGNTTTLAKCACERLARKWQLEVFHGGTTDLWHKPVLGICLTVHCVITCVYECILFVVNSSAMSRFEQEDALCLRGFQGARATIPAYQTRLPRLIVARC